MRDWRKEIRQRLAALQLEPAREAEISRRCRSTSKTATQRCCLRALTPAEASRAALAELSESELLERELRRVERAVIEEPVVLGATRRNLMAGLLQDLRYGQRILRNRPGFSAMVVLVLALGVGATTAIFSIVNAVLLRPLPYAEPDRLMMVFTAAERNGRSEKMVPRSRLILSSGASSVRGARRWLPTRAHGPAI